MKWRALVVTGWLLLGAVGGANGQQTPASSAHDHEEAAETPALAAAASATGAEESCWTDYVERAIEIYWNLIECVKENEWYDTFGYLICELSYEFGAFMAFIRLMACMST
jgi:hypothetical protein